MSMDDFPAQPPAVFLSVEAIDVPDRLRPIDESYVEFLATSIEDNGLQQPIIVRLADEGGRHSLVAGAHRFAAVRRLGHPDIACVVYEDLDDDSARLIEIDENLVRRELNALDRAVFLRERKDVYERLNPTARHGGDRRAKSKWQSLPLESQVFSPRFTREVADKTGFSERAVRLSIQLAENLDPEAVANLRGTRLVNNQSQLVALSQHTPAQQRTLSAALRDGRAKTVDAAKVASGFKVETAPADPEEQLYTTLVATWARAGTATRARFLAAIKASEQAAKAPRR